MNGSITPEANAAASRRRFPIVRALIAMIVVPIATVVVPEMIGEAFERKSPGGDNSPAYLLLAVPLACYYAIPGYVVFLASRPCICYIAGIDLDSSGLCFSELCIRRFLSLSLGCMPIATAPNI